VPTNIFKHKQQHTTSGYYN